MDVRVVETVGASYVGSRISQAHYVCPSAIVYHNRCIIYFMVMAIIRQALKYGSECRAMKVSNRRKIAITKMKMLRGILGASRWDHMR